MFNSLRKENGILVRLHLTYHLFNNGKRSGPRTISWCSLEVAFEIREKFFSVSCTVNSKQ